MRKLVWSACAAGLWLGALGGARADDAALGVLERAVKAHGGEERLAKIRADKVKLKGVFYVAAKEIPFTAETTVQLPGQFRNVIQLTGDRKVTILQILNGDKTYVAFDGQPQKVEAAAAAEIREMMQLDQAVRLVPLLADKSFTLEGLGESKVGDQAVWGVKASAKGRRDVLLFFDKETYLLVKTEHQLNDGGDKEVKQEEFYSDFKDVDGYKRPMKISVRRNGNKLMEAELTDVHYLDKVDDAEFAKP
jgi:hypothetical protein